MKFNLGHDQIKKMEFWRAIFAEFLAMTLFLLIVTTAVLSWSPQQEPDASANNLKISVGVGLAITVLVHAFGHVSGAHLNPSVSIAMIVTGKISVIQGLLYMASQTLGGIVGSALTYAITTSKTRGDMGVPKLGPSVSTAQGFAVELLFTFILVFFIFGVVDEKRKTEPFTAALGIGIVVVVAHICAIPLTSCCINPARALGPAVVIGNFENQWLYWIGSLMGGVIAAIVYKYIFFVPHIPNAELSENSELHRLNKSDADVA